MRRALVTGGSGFIGANLVRRLLADGLDTHVLLRPGSNDWRLEEIIGDLRVHRAAIADADKVQEVVTKVRPSHVFHLAVYGAYPNQHGLAEMVRTNIEGTAWVVRAAVEAGAESIVLAGSSSEYGFVDHAPLESEVLRPNSDYAFTKAAASMYGSMLRSQAGTRITTLRLYSAYGPWEEPSRLIPTTAVRGLQGRFPNLAAPTTSRDFVAVEDVVHAFVLAAIVPKAGSVYNVASGTPLSLADVMKVAARQFGLTHEPAWGTMEARSWDTDVWVGNSRLAEAELGWRAGTSFAEGFSGFVDWLGASPSRLRRYVRGAAP